MNELRDVKALTQPNEILLVIDAMIGRKKPLTLRENLTLKLELPGVILTKIDGDTVVVLPFLLRHHHRKTNQIHRYWWKDYGYWNLSTPIVWLAGGSRYGRYADFDWESFPRIWWTKKPFEMAEDARKHLDFNDFIDQLDQVQNM